MNKRVLVMAVVLMAVAMLTVSVNIVLTETVYTEHQYVGGNSVIDVPGQTMIRLVFQRFEGDYYSGIADRIAINVHTGTFTPAGLPNFKSVANYEDNPERNAFSAGLGTPQVQNLVEPGQIQILRVGKSNTIMVHWNIPLVAPATGAPNPTPAVTLPPGKLVVVGFGEVIIGIPLPLTPIGTTGWKYSIPTVSYYHAEATLFCEGWDYKWLPVAENYAGTTMEPRVSDQTFIWTHL